MLVLHEDLIALAWSEPMRDLAAKLGLSDVGLRKKFASYGVPIPPQGYWNKVHAGKPTPPIPGAAPRRPGETGRASVDSSFAKLLTKAQPLSAAGPFASQEVPEDLDELFAREIRLLGRVTAPKTLDAPHAGLVKLLKQEERRRERFSTDRWTSTPPNFDTILARRRLRILNGILLALRKRGHGGDAYEHNGAIHARAIIGGTYLGLDLAIVGKYRTVRQYGYDRPAPDLPATTPLILRMSPGFDGRATRSWEDDNAGELEAKLAEITAGLIVAGEARFRASLREEEERDREAQLEQERKRQRRLAELNQKRIQNLRESGDLLRQAQDIRSLVERVRHAIENGSTIVDEAALAAWVRWALAEADKIDPVLSGQFMTHLDEPSL
ncbi:hypothetical protein J1W56_12260 [Phyllobacterium sp. R2-JL]|nr:hypothetical protein [Phyllobacterium calauticae]